MEETGVKRAGFVSVKTSSSLCGGQKWSFRRGI